MPAGFLRINASGLFDISAPMVSWSDMSSGCVYSGTLSSGSLSSGEISATSRTTCWDGYVSEEAISGGRAVCISQSGNLRVAMAGVSGRMPAIGVVVGNFTSGVAIPFVYNGPVRFTSGLVNYSGQLGQRLYVGRSGHVTQMSGWFGSGGLLSGDLYQILGVARGSGEAFVQVDMMLRRSGLTEVAFP